MLIVRVLKYILGTYLRRYPGTKGSGSILYVLTYLPGYMLQLWSQLQPDHDESQDSVATLLASLYTPRTTLPTAYQPWKRTSLSNQLDSRNAVESGSK